MSLFQLLKDFIGRHRRHYLMAALMLFAVAVLTVLIPRRVGALIDQLVRAPQSQSELILELGWILAMGVAIYFLRVGWRMQLFTASYQLGAEIRTRLYQCLSLQGQPFFQQKRTGDLMALGTNDADAIELAAGEAALAGFDGSLTFVLVIGMMLLGVDWRLALVALIPFPLMALAFRHITHQVHEASRESLDCFSHLNDHVQENIAGVRTVRALGLEQHSAGRFAELAERAAASSLSAQRWEAAYEPAVGLTLTSSGLLSLAVGGYLVWHGEMSIGKLTAFTMYLGQLIWPMFAAGWVLALLERGKAAWGRLQPVLDASPSVPDHGRLHSKPHGSIEFQQIDFRYPGQSRLALHDFSLEIAAGQTVGIVGPTGAGKSSVIRLLLRQGEPAGGQLRWDGQPLADYRLQQLRSAINWVAQEPFLFSASIADNISLSNPAASRAQIMQAAQLAAIHDDILRFPQGYDTPVGERGVTLSGGQRQRVAIARALLSDSALLILDDALSAVDTETETRILQHLKSLRLRQHGQSAIIISHRLSAVADADHIIVLRDGSMTEQGSHAALLAAGGWYASQWRYQQLEASLDAA